MRRLLIILTLALLSSPLSATQTIGWLESVELENGVTLQAKIDTGADNSSLHADNIRLFNHQGEQWVAFDVKGRALQRPLLRQAQIKRKGQPPQPRPVIELALCLAGRWHQVEINLADRSQFSTPMLIGRSLLAGHYLVDSGRTHLSEPGCPQR